MKKSRTKGTPAERISADEILPQYDFKRSAPNKFASRYAAGSAVVVLEPDVAAAFPSSGEANEALRALAGLYGPANATIGPAISEYWLACASCVRKVKRWSSWCQPSTGWAAS